VAHTYHLSFIRRAVNVVFHALLKAGLVPGSTYLLTTRGRKTGQLHSTPVILVERDGQRWLVAPYGAVPWVLNARSAGEVTLSRGRQSETVRIEEADAATSAPILKIYLTHVPVVRPFFDVQPTSSLEAFVAEAPRHPVFRLGGLAN
jgi:deazaflavin-dependent oxidoreductase (nitroreductase family)